MKAYKHLYSQLCCYENLLHAFQKAKKRKSKKAYVAAFEKNLSQELQMLQRELELQTYQPKPLQKFIIRDPKTRTIHASHFRDRVVYHALVNILEPIFEKLFIYDSYASRKGKGSHKAIQRFDAFKRKISQNGKLTRDAYDNNHVIGFVFKADIKHYFDTVDHSILLKIIGRKIHDKKIIWLIKKILSNFETPLQGKGMPLGNLTSQFFANVYLNELDYFVKQELKATYYIRYVDDFVILHYGRRILEYYRERIYGYLKTLQLELHPDKSKIIPLRDGVTFLGYRIFYHYKLLRKSNLRKFQKNWQKKLALYQQGLLSREQLIGSLQGWFGYAQWADTYKLRKRAIQELLKIYLCVGNRHIYKLPNNGTE